MRILIMSYLKKDSKKHQDILKKLEQTAVACGHQVDVKEGDRDYDQLHLVIYDYIAVVVPASPFIGAKLNPKITEAFAQGGSTSGKKGCALVVKSGFSSEKMCRVVMKAMEKEGIVVDYFEVITNADHAAYIGKRLG